LLAALIAHGTNLGIAAMGQSAQGITVDALQHVTRWFLREDTIKAANAALINFHHQLPISRVWGEGVASSSDGQRFGIQQSSLLASYYPRYFGYYERAVTVYTHTSDQYSVFGTRIISCSPREALYDDVSNQYSPITIVAAVSSQFGNPPHPREVPLRTGTRSGLRKPSAVILNQIRSIDRARLRQRLGMLDAGTMRQVDEALKISLGLIAF
jgi:mRNA-degrading endonuclease toxin of MazEF toxin-antitoxin module